MEELGSVVDLAREARGWIKLAWPTVRFALPTQRRRYTREDMKAAEAWGKYQALVLRE